LQTSSDNREVIACPLTNAAKTFLGRDLYEAQAFFNQETQNAELSRSRQIQSRSQAHAIQDHVTKIATEKTSEAFENAEPVSNTGRLKGIRDNRTLEKDFERTKDIWMVEEPGVDSNLIESNPDQQDAEEFYIAPKSNADKIREIRKQKRGGKNS
jgi:hypothetical protein